MNIIELNESFWIKIICIYTYIIFYYIYKYIYIYSDTLSVPNLCCICLREHETCAGHFVRGGIVVLLIVPKLTANLYYICLSEQETCSKADAVKICGKIWNAQYVSCPVPYFSIEAKRVHSLYKLLNPFTLRFNDKFATARQRTGVEINYFRQFSCS